ncbi:helix-turn-helix domain-containing protein [Butyrivibrio sp. AE2032]|uniref:helix-turn-helix domain-containing protein n=1 Tax=Butyrivibrio sp. AE2032 TaxID=1458463 RepID=UPI00054F2FB7|nr:helix-turn-helix domain-containing protein [Butyrivibrio sp. AE2032]
MDQQKIGEFLKTLRKEKNLTQEELADKMNVSRRTVSRWETGSNLPDLAILVELADLYDVDMREIFNGERKNETMDKELKETMLMAADYTDDHMQKVLRRFQLMFGASTVCGIIYLIGLFVGPENGSPVFDFISGICLGIMFGMLIIGILVTDRHFAKITEWKRSLLGKTNK